jgi:hypothetical protein
MVEKFAAIREASKASVQGGLEDIAVVGPPSRINTYKLRVLDYYMTTLTPLEQLLLS